MVKEGFYIVIVVGIIAAIAWVVGMVGPQAQAGAVAVANVQNAPVLAQQTVTAGQQALEAQRLSDAARLAAINRQAALDEEAARKKMDNDRMLVQAEATRIVTEGNAAIVKEQSSAAIGSALLNIVAVVLFLFTAAGVFWTVSEQTGRHRKLSQANKLVQLALNGGHKVELPNGYKIEPMPKQIEAPRAEVGIDAQQTRESVARSGPRPGLDERRA